MSKKKYETFAVLRQSDFAVIAIREKRIYMQLAEKFKDELTDFLKTGEQNIIIDLSDVSVMNSAALGVLIALQNDIENREGKLSIVGLQPLMEEIFYRMRLELLFNIDYSVDTALQKYSGR